MTKIVSREEALIAYERELRGGGQESNYGRLLSIRVHPAEARCPEEEAILERILFDYYFTPNPKI